MKIAVSLIAAVSVSGLLGCSSASPSPESEDLQTDNASGQPASGEIAALGSGGAAAADKIVAVAAESPSSFMAPGEQVLFNTLRADRSTPSWINPTLRANEWVCALSTLQGNFQDYQSGGRVWVDPNTNFWNIVSIGNGIVRGNCVPLSRFTGPNQAGASSPARWVSGRFTKWNSGGDCYTFRSSINTWWGDAATFMTGTNGFFYGMGESVNVWQSSNGTSPSQIYTGLCQGFNWIDAQSIFVGNPGTGIPAKFRGPLNSGNAAAAGEYVVDRSTVSMAPVDETFCYFTSIQGALAGDGEKAEIFAFENPFDNNRLYWAMRTFSQQGQLVAKARCYLLNQF